MSYCHNPNSTTISAVIGGAKTAQGELGVLTRPDQDGTLVSTVNIGTPVGQDVTTTKYTNHSKVA